MVHSCHTLRYLKYTLLGCMHWFVRVTVAGRPPWLVRFLINSGSLHDVASPDSPLLEVVAPACTNSCDTKKSTTTTEPLECMRLLG